MNIRWERIVVFWGALDLIRFSYYFLAQTLSGKLPIVSDLVSAWSNATHFGFFFPLIWTFLWLVLFLSLAPSGILLIQKRVAGAVIAYVQTPFRLLLAMPSIPFVTALFPNNFDETKILFIAIPIFIVVEIVKVVTIAKWHRGLKFRSLPQN